MTRRPTPAGRAALALLILVSGLLSTAVGKGLPRAPEEEWVTTSDRWRLPLLHFPPLSGASRHHTPVVLVHGTAVNRMNWMATPDNDLPTFLSRRGFDVFVVELRGDREAIPPDAASRRAGDWDLDTHLKEDLPALLHRIERKTGRRKVHWVGHSMGGILGYAYAGQVDREGVESLILIGSPARLDPLSGAQRMGVRLQSLAPRRGRLATAPLLRLALPLFLDIRNRLAHDIVNMDNVNLSALRGVMRYGLEPVASGLIRQYQTWVREKDITDRHGKISYTRSLEEITCPLLVVAGRADGIVPPWQARAAYELVGSEDRSYLLMGKAWGYSADYGHGDLMVGRMTPRDLFPEIARWLEARD